MACDSQTIINNHNLSSQKLNSLFLLSELATDLSSPDIEGIYESQVKLQLIFFLCEKCPILHVSH